MCDAFNFGICYSILQYRQGTNKMNLISANSILFTQAELSLSTIMKKCKAIVFTLNSLYLDQNIKQFYLQIMSQYFFYLHRNLILTRESTDLISRQNAALPDTLSRNTPPELLTWKTTVEIRQNINFSRKRQNITTFRM